MYVTIILLLVYGCGTWSVILKEEHRLGAFVNRVPGKIFWPKMKYRSADKSLARLGRKEATATEDFDFHISYF
jgi:hypothetical protein